MRSELMRRRRCTSRRTALNAAFAILACATCACHKIGGPCEYVSVPGTATILAIRTAPAGANNCPNDPVEVTFQFAPTDPSKAEAGDARQTLTVFSGENPSRAFVTGKAIVEGKTFRCVRQDETEGTCTPVAYVFPDVGHTDDTCYTTPGR